MSTDGIEGEFMLQMSRPQPLLALSLRNIRKHSLRTFSAYAVFDRSMQAIARSPPMVFIVIGYAAAKE